MKIAFDTNVLIDAIAERREYRDAQALILAVAQERIDGVISANSITISSVSGSATERPEKRSGT